MLDVTVRFEKKDATVRYLPEKVKLDQILKRYDDTPFEVSLDGPIVTIARTKQLTLRGWTQRAESKLISLLVELVPVAGTEMAPSPQLSLSDPPTAGLTLAKDFQKVEPVGKVKRVRWVAQLAVSVTPKPGELTVPVSFEVATIDDAKKQDSAKGQLNVVLRTVAKKPTANPVASTGIAMIGGALELRLGHLCDQARCVEHFHNSLTNFGGIAAVRPLPSLKDPRATVFLRDRQAIDV